MWAARLCILEGERAEARPWFGEVLVGKCMHDGVVQERFLEKEGMLIPKGLVFSPRVLLHS